MHVQYVTNEQGKQVGVLIELTDYRRLLAASPSDPEIFIDLSQDELEAMAESKLAPEKQSQLDDLLTRQEQEGLSLVEEAQLDHLLSQIDQLTILKTRALYTLQERSRA